MRLKRARDIGSRIVARRVDEYIKKVVATKLATIIEIS